LSLEAQELGKLTLNFKKEGSRDIYIPNIFKAQKVV
jgi:hypothetical protein